MKKTTSEEYFERAKRVIPGGVNSPVRAFLSVGGTPRFIESAHGARLVDVEGREYIDYLSSWGPMLLGHCNEKVTAAVEAAMKSGISFGAATVREVELAELITSLVPNIEMIRMVNSGTEAVMSALRLARGYTGREKVIKFIGCYHGHADSMLVKAGSGALTLATPNSGGVTAGAAADTLLATYNDLESVRVLLEENHSEIAAIIVEPVAANMGVIPPQAGFLAGLRKLCDANGTLLIFDEVITGFRLGISGAQGYYGVTADIVTYGKIIGGGMPVGAYGGRRDIMQCVAPLGNVYQAGTLSGNPLAMAAGLATITELAENPQLYSHIDGLGKRLAHGLSGMKNSTVNVVGSLVCCFCTGEKVENYSGAMKSDAARYARAFHHLLDGGIYIAPAQFEAMFISAAHSEDDIDRTIACFKEVNN